MDYSNEVIGRRLHSGMVDRGMGAQDLAARLGVSAEVVKNWMSGRTAVPFTTAAEICDIFEWPLDRLMVRESGC
ncbi:MAG: helix-turn-helix transcriptional regulator [Eggerthellaceae bacterium]|nr:helix-turn-helix transcriptional regulator [Eggerthellaceae bacterium]